MKQFDQTASSNKGALAVMRANRSSDYIVLTVTFICFFLATSAYFIASYFLDEEVSRNGGGTIGEFMLALLGGAIVFTVILLIGMFLVRMQRQQALGNSLQVEYSDYAWLRDWSNEVAADLSMPRVEIFVTQDPVINAYAFGFMKPYCIVLHSGSIRYLSKEELKVIVIHEMAHVKYGHTLASVYLQPFVMLPVIGAFVGWFAGFWYRRCELTADRLALMYMQDPELVKESLIKVHVGPDVAESMNDVARQWLQYNAERPMNRLAQTFSSHPFLVRRLSHIDAYAPIIEGEKRASS